MEIQIKHYDNILMLQITGIVTNPNIINVTLLIRSLIGKVTHVIADLGKAQLEKDVELTLHRLKSQLESDKIKLHLVAENLRGMSFKTLVDALDGIGTSECSRITSLFTLEHEFRELQAKNNKIKAMISKTLGMNDPKIPFKLEAIRAALKDLEEKQKKFLHLLDSIPKESPSRKKEQDNPEAIQKIAQAKTKALAAIHSSGVLK